MYVDHGIRHVYLGARVVYGLGSTHQDPYLINSLTGSPVCDTKGSDVVLPRDSR